MSHDLRWIAPIPPEPDFAVLEAHQLGYEFREEVQQRARFDRYCQWYYATALNHQREAQKMQNDINLFGWFCRGRR
jgi:hypothetical protein